MGFLGDFTRQQGVQTHPVEPGQPAREADTWVLEPSLYAGKVPRVCPDAPRRVLKGHTARMSDLSDVHALNIALNATATQADIACKGLYARSEQADAYLQDCA